MPNAPAAHIASPHISRESQASILVFTTCPSSLGVSEGYLEKVAQVARWSEAAGCAGMLAPFVVASFAPDPRPDVAYLDNVLDGNTTEKRDQVARVALHYDALAREALTPADSAELIRQVMQAWT